MLGVYLVSCFLPDATLTPRNVLAALRTVKDVEMFWLVLDVPLYKRHQLAHSKKETVNYFLQTHPYASWKWLGGRLLYWQRDENAVRHVKSHIKPDEGMYM